MPTITVTVDEREHATILAALRAWAGQGATLTCGDAICAIATDNERLVALNAEEAADLCERINAPDFRVGTAITITDVVGAAESRDETLSDERALAFLHEHHQDIMESMSTAANYALDHLYEIWPQRPSAASSAAPPRAAHAAPAP